MLFFVFYDKLIDIKKFPKPQVVCFSMGKCHFVKCYICGVAAAAPFDLKIDIAWQKTMCFKAFISIFRRCDFDYMKMI